MPVGDLDFFSAVVLFHKRDVRLTGGQSLSSGSSISRPKSSLRSVLVSCITDPGSQKSSSRPFVLREPSALIPCGLPEHVHGGKFRVATAQVLEVGWLRVEISESTVSGHEGGVRIWTDRVRASHGRSHIAGL